MRLIVNIYNKLKFVGLMCLVLGVSACGGGGGGTTTPPLEKTYTVAVSVPDVLSPPPVDENFAVAIVDPAGNILEVVDVPADKITKNIDGTWQITIPGDLRFDRIIMVDMAKPVEVFVGSPIPSGVVYAPTTALSIDIDILSTAGYQEFLLYQSSTISTFADLTNISIDEVENIINTAQEVVLPSISVDQTLDEYIQVAAAAVVEVIATEIAIAEVSDPTSTAGGLDEAVAAGGIYWFGGPADSFIPGLEYGVITDGLVEQVFNFDGTSSTLIPSVTAYSLTATGFQQVSELVTVSSINANGSVTIAWEGDANMSFTINPVDTVDVNGLNIQTLLANDEDTAFWASVTDATKAFSTSGALGFRSNLTVVNNYYEIYGEINCDPMVIADPAVGCNSIFLLDSTGQPISALKLTDLESATKGDKVLPIGMDPLSTKSLVASLVDNGTTKTVHFFEIDYTDDTIPPVELTETTTWEFVTENTVEFLRFTPPAALTQNWEIYTGTSTLAFFEHANYVRQAELIPAGTTAEGSFLLFNESAAQDILAAVDTSTVVAGCPIDDPSQKSYADFEAASTACMTPTGGAITKAELDDVTVFITDTSSYRFNADGSIDLTQGGVLVTFDAYWSIDASGNILFELLDAGIVTERREYRIIAMNPGLEYSVKVFTSEGEAIISTGSLGTISSQLWSVSTI